MKPNNIYTLNDGETRMMARPFDPEATGEASFLFASWKSTYQASDNARRITRDPVLRMYARLFEAPSGKPMPSLYWGLQQRLITSLLDRKETMVTMGVWEDDPTVVLGWVCAEPVRQILHYAATKADYKRLGVCRTLLQHIKFGCGDEVSYTHVTDDVDSLLPNTWKYRPHLAFP